MSNLDNVYMWETPSAHAHNMDMALDMPFKGPLRCSLTNYTVCNHNLFPCSVFNKLG